MSNLHERMLPTRNVGLNPQPSDHQSMHCISCFCCCCCCFLYNNTLVRRVRRNYFCYLSFRRNKPWQSIPYKIALSVKIPISLRIRAVGSVFSVRLKTLGVLGYPQSALQRLRSDCADAQSDVSLRWAHMQSCRKCCEPAQLSFNWFNCPKHSDSK